MGKISTVSRVDRAVADNMSSIRESFGNQAGLVQDFIIFIMKNLKENLFGYTQFTMADFCRATGCSRQVLSLVDESFRDGRRKAPVKDDVVFSTTFDFALYSMMQRNLVFTHEYQTMRGEKAVRMKSIGLISDVNIILGKKGVKIYQVRISQDLLEGFVSRYYTLDARAYRLIGKGRGGTDRKAFLIYLCKFRHILFSKNRVTARFPLDVLAAEARITAKENKHTKQQVERLLSKLKDTDFPFSYKFVASGPDKVLYYVEITFERVISNTDAHREHSFYFALLDEYTTYFNRMYGDRNFKEKEPFQRWMTEGHDSGEKIATLKRLYKKFFGNNIGDGEALAMIQFGFVETEDPEPVDDGVFDFLP